MYYKSNKKGHVAQNCTAKIYRVGEETDLALTNLFRVLEGTERIKLSEKGKVNWQPVKRIHLDNGASRTTVDRNLISPADIGKKIHCHHVGNGPSGEYPLAPARVKIDD